MIGSSQTVRMVTWGAALWFVFALAIRLTPFLFGADATTAVLFAASVPVAWLMVSLLIWVGRLRPHQVLAGVAVALAAAMVLDGIAITWLDRLYGDSASHVRGGAAYILWGAGLMLGIAVIRGRAAVPEV